MILLIKAELVDTQKSMISVSEFIYFNGKCRLLYYWSLTSWASNMEVKLQFKFLFLLFLI